MILKRRELFLLIFYLFMLLVIGVYFFFFRFVYPRYKIINNQILGAEEALVKINRILASKVLVEKEFNTFEKKFATDKEEQAASWQILQNIKSKATNAGLNVINIKPLVMKQEGSYGAFDFKLETEGYLQNFGKFLYNLDDSPYIFTLKYTQLNAQARGEPLKVQLLLSAAVTKG